MTDDNTQGTGDAANPPATGGTTPPPPPAGQQPPAAQPPAGTPPPAAGGTTPPPPPPPAGAGAPPAGIPPMPGMPPAPGAAKEPEDTTPANFQLGVLLKEGIKVKLAEHPDTTFEDDKFLLLLASSISLSRAEKKRILDAIPKLKQWQIDELVNIFEEEKTKFAQLSKKHVPQLEKLAKQHFEEWRDIEMEQQQSGAAQEDEAKAEEIRKNLGL